MIISNLVWMFIAICRQIFLYESEKKSSLKL